MCPDPCKTTRNPRMRLVTKWRKTAAEIKHIHHLSWELGYAQALLDAASELEDLA